VSNDLATLYGFVASARFRGAKNTYFFNWMDSGTIPVTKEQYRILLEKGLGDDVIFHSTRRYPITYRDTVSAGVSNNVQLPKTTDATATFTIPIGLKPKSGKLLLIIGLGKNENVKDAVLSATLNETKVTAIADVSLEHISSDGVRTLCFDCPLDTAKDGVNTITVKQESGAAQKIVWVELRVEVE